MPGVIIALITSTILLAVSSPSWPNAAEAVLAAAHRYTIIANMLRCEVGLAILRDRATGQYTYSSRLHYGDTAITIDTADPADVPAGYDYVGTWHAHGSTDIDSLDGHVATISKHPTIIVWTSYQGYVMAQFWDSQLNGGKGAVHEPIDICPHQGSCVPVP